MEKVSEALKERLKFKLSKQAYIENLPEDLQPIAGGAIAGSALGMAKPIYSKGLDILSDTKSTGGPLYKKLAKGLGYGGILGANLGALYGVYKSPEAMEILQNMSPFK